jgi:hypothetical protein
MSLQELIAILIALVAVAWLVRRGLEVLRGDQRGGCGTCVDCPGETARESLPVRKQLYSLGDGE